MGTSDFQLGPWLVQPASNRVIRDGRESRLEPRAMEVLCFLATRRGDVATKQELLDEVWSGTHVSDEALTYAISHIRKALGDDARRPSFVENVPRKGYRLVAPVTFAEERKTRWCRERIAWSLAGAALIVSIVAWYAAARLGGAGLEPTAIVVLRFEDHTGADDDRWLSNGVPSMLMTDLAQSPGLRLVQGETTDAGAARRTGVDAVVAGEIYRDGDEIRIDARVHHSDDGAVLYAHSVRGTSVFSLVEELTERLRRDFRLGDTGGERPLTEITTASIDAYRLYSEGLVAARNARWDDAWSLLHQAIDIDPDFAMAYFQLSKLHRPEHPFLKTEYRQAVLSQLDRLPERERLVVLATYEEDTARAVRLFEELLDRYPEEEDAYRLLSYHYIFELGEPDKALAVMRRGMRELPSTGSLLNEYGFQLMDLGRHQEAIDAFVAYTEANPDEPNPFHSLAHAYLVAGELDEAHAALDRALELDPDFSEAYTARAWAYGIEGRFDEAIGETRRAEAALAREGHERMKLENQLMRAFLLSRVGRYEEARETSAIGITLADTLGSPTMLAPFELLSILFDVELGELDRARERLALLGEHGAQHHDVANVLTIFSGVVAARLHEFDEARGFLAAMTESSSHPEITAFWRHSLAGEIALAEGDVVEARQAFAAALPATKMWFYPSSVSLSLAANNLIVRDGLARALLAEGDRDGAVAAYRSLLSHGSDAKWVSVLEPRFVLELARLLEAAGDMEDAAREYRRFRELWKRADPGLPELTLTQKAS